MAFIQFRKLSSTSCNYAKIIPKNLKGKSKSSQEWLTRQLTDPYVEKAKMYNYRCRSAFKLIEIDDKYKILKPGDVVIDCGASPGSWSQIAVDRTNANGKNEKQPKGAVLSVDLLHIHPIDGATIFSRTNFTNPESQLRLKTALDGRAVNCVLSDMAPNATGVRVLDQENITELCYSVLRFALAMSAVGGHLVVKIWDNAAVPKLEKDMLKFYEKVKRVKPFSSRSDSAEHFMVARNFKDEIYLTVLSCLTFIVLFYPILRCSTLFYPTLKLSEQTYSLAKTTGIVSKQSSAVARTTADTAKMVSNALPLWRLAGNNYNFIRLAGISGASAVVLGAIGSHRTAAVQDKGESKAIFETANRFHFFHSIALMAVPLAKRPILTGSLMAAGTLFFSGVLYYRALSGDKALSRLAPIGGFCLIVAWLTLLV